MTGIITSVAILGLGIDELNIAVNLMEGKRTLTERGDKM